MSTIADYLDTYTYEYLLQQALNTVPNTVDKRQGSIIYDALAPACYRLAAFYLDLKQAYLGSFVQYAEGAELDLKVAEQGVYRDAATHAVKKATFKDSTETNMAVPIGARFSTISDTNPIYYTVTEQYNSEVGVYKLTCETGGTIGNEYTGDLLAVTYVQGLTSSVMSDLLTAATAAETDDELRVRYLSALSSKPFGGNVADYNTLLKDITGVGDVQVYPTWNGGGTVKISVVDDDYRALSAGEVDILQEAVDPTLYSGTGLGLAPIGHSVTVTTPTELTVNVSATVVLMSGYTIGSIQAAVEAAIEAYMLELRTNWGVEDELNHYSLGVYISRVNMAILSVMGVANVSTVLLNGSASDITLTETSTTQQIPIMGTVTLSV